MTRRGSLTLSLFLVVIVRVLPLAAGPSRAGDADSITNFKLGATIQIPLADKTINPQQVFRFFDISWVDEPTERYLSPTGPTRASTSLTPKPTRLSTGSAGLLDKSSLRPAPTTTPTPVPTASW